MKGIQYFDHGWISYKGNLDYTVKLRVFEQYCASRKHVKRRMLEILK